MHVGRYFRASGSVPLWAVCVAFSLGCAMAADEGPIVKEGSYWTRVTAGRLKGAVQQRLQVISRGRIVLRGVEGNQVSFRFKQQVHGKTEDEARRMFGTVLAGLEPVGAWTRLIVTPVSSPNVITELEVDVPRQMVAAALETELGGGIEAYDFDGDIQAKTRAGAIRMDRIKGNILGQTGGGEIRLGTIAGTVRCSTGGGSVYLDNMGPDTNCATAGGDIVVQQAGGPLTLATEGGNIRVRRAASTVQAHSAEGLIEVGEAGGVVHADTAGGSILVDSAPGIRAESMSGTVRVKSAPGPMNIAAAAGSILAELISAGRMQNSSLMTSAGDITVLIPSNMPVSVMATNESGGMTRIVSEFPEIHVNTGGLIRPPLVAQGALNGGGPVLRINAGSGVIYLRKIK